MVLNDHKTPLSTLDALCNGGDAGVEAHMHKVESILARIQDFNLKNKNL